VLAGRFNSVKIIDRFVDQALAAGGGDGDGEMGFPEALRRRTSLLRADPGPCTVAAARAAAVSNRRGMEVLTLIFGRGGLEALGTASKPVSNLLELLSLAAMAGNTLALHWCLLVCDACGIAVDPIALATDAISEPTHSPHNVHVPWGAISVSVEVYQE
jgi:hypothetical protein